MSLLPFALWRKTIAAVCSSSLAYLTFLSSVVVPEYISYTDSGYSTGSHWWYKTARKARMPRPRGNECVLDAQNT